MPKFRKKLVEVEAVQFLGGRENLADILRLGHGIGLLGENYLTIDTLEGVMRAAKGDWIIQGVSGELYPCKPDIFEQTYEAVEV